MCLQVLCPVSNVRNPHIRACSSLMVVTWVRQSAIMPFRTYLCHLEMWFRGVVLCIRGVRFHMLGTTTAVFLLQSFICCCVVCSENVPGLIAHFSRYCQPVATRSSTVVTTLHFRMFRSKPQPTLLQLSSVQLCSVYEMWTKHDTNVQRPSPMQLHST